MAAGYTSFLAFWLGGAQNPSPALPGIAGYYLAEVTQFYVNKATPRPNMPICYIRVIYKYNTDADPNTGESPSSQPPYNN